MLVQLLLNFSVLGTSISGLTFASFTCARVNTPGSHFPFAFYATSGVFFYPLDF